MTQRPETPVVGSRRGSRSAAAAGQPPDLAPPYPLPSREAPAGVTRPPAPAKDEPMPAQYARSLFNMATILEHLCHLASDDEEFGEEVTDELKPIRDACYNASSRLRKR